MPTRQINQHPLAYEPVSDPDRLRPRHVVLFVVVATVALVSSLGLMATWLIQAGNDRRATWQLHDLQSRYDLLETEQSSLRDQLTQSERTNVELADAHKQAQSTAESLNAAKAAIVEKQRAIDNLNIPAERLDRINQEDLLERFDRFRVMPVLDANSKVLGLREGAVMAQAEISIRNAGFVRSDASPYVVIVWIDSMSVPYPGLGKDRTFAVVRASLTVPLRVTGTSFAAAGEVHSAGQIVFLGLDGDDSIRILDVVSEVTDDLFSDIRAAHDVP